LCLRHTGQGCVLQQDCWWLWLMCWSLYEILIINDPHPPTS
jgi:hypothetical protein